MRRYVFFMVFALLSGCVTIAPLEAEYAGPDAGFLVVSLSRTKTRFDSVGFVVRKDVPGAGSAIEGNKISLPNADSYKSVRTTFEGDGANGVVYTLKLKPGPYALDRFTGSVRRNGSADAWEIDDPVVIRFEIKPGRVAYLGWYDALEKRNTTPFVGGGLNGIRYAVASRLQRDLASAAQRVPLNLDAVDDLTPTQSVLAGSSGLVLK
jgi:hypothetical protein